MSDQAKALVLAGRLQACANDPMWAHHAEITKATAGAAAAELRRLHSVNAELLEALQWAMSTGLIKYNRRLPGQNDAWCDAVDRANSVLARALGQ